MTIRPRFLDGPSGRLFSILTEAPSTDRCVLFVPPFGEELNRCRRQIKETTDALYQKGISSLVVDLFGTGDSDGEFQDASWSKWKKDLSFSMDWLMTNGLHLHAIVAIRLGCILIAECMAEGSHRVDRSIFWQPILDGRRFMQQFLRLRVASSMSRASGETVENLRKSLGAGSTLDVGGYRLTPNLYHAVTGSSLTESVGVALGNLTVIEVSRSTLPGREIGGGDLWARLRDVSGARIVRVTSEPFWAVSSSSMSSQLISETVREIEGT